MACEDNRLYFYVTARSPFCYLAVSRVQDMARKHDLEIELKPVYPLAQRDPNFFERSNPLLMAYNLRDAARVAEFLGLPYRWPNPDPVLQDLESCEIAAEQPHIQYLSHLMVAAAESGRGFEFYREMSALIFSPDTVWNEGQHLAEASDRAGCSLSDIEARIEAHQHVYEARLISNAADMMQAGHWGTPLLVWQGEPFYGQDRIDICDWRILKTRGV